MQNYALIDSGGNVVNVVMWDGESDWKLPEGLVTEQSDIAAIGWTYVNGEFSPPAAPAVTQPTIVPLSVPAGIELNKVTGPSGTIIRCVTAGVPVPLEWTTYVKALRAIVNGTDTSSTVLPTIPAYPAGT